MANNRAKEREKKKRNRYIFRAAVLAGLIGLIIFVVVTNMNKDKELYRVGDEAPDFQLSQINEESDIEKIRLSDLRGKGVMLNFWATYCEPCEAEMPFMEELYPQYEDEIEIVAVSLDYNQLVIDKFINKHNLTFPIVHDKKSEVMDLYKVGPIPSTFFIDPEGKIVEYVSGPLTLDKLAGYFDQIKP